MKYAIRSYKQSKQKRGLMQSKLFILFVIVGDHVEAITKGTSLGFDFTFLWVTNFQFTLGQLRFSVSLETEWFARERERECHF